VRAQLPALACSIIPASAFTAENHLVRGQVAALTCCNVSVAGPGDGVEPARRSREDDLPNPNKGGTRTLSSGLGTWSLRMARVPAGAVRSDVSPGLHGRADLWDNTRRPRLCSTTSFWSIEGTPMEILSAVLCREAKQTGPRDWSIAGEFDRVFLDSFPNEFGPVTVMINWRMEANEERKPLQIRVADHEGNAIAPVIMTRYPAPTAEESMSQRITGVIPGRWESITFKTPGDYRAQVWIGGEVAWSKDFRVNQTLRG
jgi:hypothetical protein